MSAIDIPEIIALVTLSVVSASFTAFIYEIRSLRKRLRMSQKNADALTKTVLQLQAELLSCMRNERSAEIDALQAKMESVEVLCELLRERIVTASLKAEVRRLHNELRKARNTLDVPSYIIIDQEGNIL